MAAASTPRSAPAAAGVFGSVANIAARLDRLSINRLHLLAVALCAAAMFVDGLELTMSGVFGSVFTPKQGVSPIQLAALLSAVGVGSLFGSPLFGVVGDRFGRRASLVGALLLFGAFSIVGGLSRGMTALTDARFVAAFGIGAFQPLMAAYLVDLLPRQSRGRLILYTSVVAGFGAASPMFTTRFFMELHGFPIDGWRATLHLGGAVAILIASLLLALLPESPRWLAEVGRSAEADAICKRFERWSRKPAQAAAPALAETVDRPSKSPARSSLFGPEFRVRTSLIFAVQALLPIVLYFVTLEGAMFRVKGHNASDALLYSGLAVVAVPFGSFVNSFIVDRFERRLAIAFAGFLLAVFLVAFLFTTSPIGAVVVAGAFNMMVGSTAVVIMIYTAELYPPYMRSLAVTSATAFGKISTIGMPFVLLPMLYKVGQWAVISTIAASVLAMAALVFVISATDEHGGHSAPSPKRRKAALPVTNKGFEVAP